MGWFKSHDGAPTDPKWLVIATRAKSKPGVAAAMWWAVLTYGNQCEPRGCVKDFDVESTAAFFGWDFEECQRVYDAFVARGLIDAAGMIVSWTKRQAADSDAERARAYRERKRARDGERDDVTPRHDDAGRVTDRDGDVTKRDEPSREITTDRQTDKTTPSVPADAGTGADAPQGASTQERIFGIGLPLLVELGIEDKHARSMLGLMRKQVGDDAALALLGRMDRERPSEPASWVNAAVRAARPDARASPPRGRKPSRTEEALDVMFNGSRSHEPDDDDRTIDAPAARLIRH